MFTKDQFIEDLKAARAEGDNHLAAREVIARAMSDPGSVVSELGEPTLGRIDALYADDDLTVLNVIWPPYMVIKPHNHLMWAVIGIYEGREDNMFWRRLPEDADGRIEAAGAKSLTLGMAEPLGKDLIHSVVNPSRKLAGAIHVYGGNFFEKPRSEWSPDTLEERPYDVEGTQRDFAEIAERWTD